MPACLSKKESLLLLNILSKKIFRKQKINKTINTSDNIDLFVLDFLLYIGVMAKENKQYMKLYHF